MNAIRRSKREMQMCGRKRAYKAKKMAIKVLHGTMANFNEPGLHVYRCPYCRRYHVGHKKDAAR